MVYECVQAIDVWGDNKQSNFPMMAYEVAKFAAGINCTLGGVCSPSQYCFYERKGD